MNVAPPVAEVSFVRDGETYVAVVYADEIAFDMVVYRRESVRYIVRGVVKAGVRWHWTADGYLVWGEWVRDSGNRRVWRGACAALGYSRP